MPSPRDHMITELPADATADLVADDPARRAAGRGLLTALIRSLAVPPVTPVAPPPRPPAHPVPTATSAGPLAGDGDASAPDGDTEDLAEDLAPTVSDDGTGSAGQADVSDCGAGPADAPGRDAPPRGKTIVPAQASHPAVVIHPPVAGAGVPPPAEREHRFARMWDDVLPTAENAGVTLVLRVPGTGLFGSPTAVRAWLDDRLSWAAAATITDDTGPAEAADWRTTLGPRVWVPAASTSPTA